MVLHGLLHLIGFAKEWNLGSQGQLPANTLLNLSGTSSRISGALWLLTSLLFIAAAIMYILRRESYWIPAALAVVASQLLIIIYWQDAKYGTIVNIVILIAIILSAAAMHFNNRASRAVEVLRSHAADEERVITPNMIATLPQNVQQWLRKSNVVGTRTRNIIRIKQKGSLRTKPGSAWMPFHAEQHFSIDPPAFVWTARIKAGTFIEIGGQDIYRDGHGNMVIKPLYLFTAADAFGKEIDQGTMLRYLAEMAWFPQAAVSKYLRWEAVSESKARVTMEYGGISASGIYSFNKENLIDGFEAKRYGDFGGIYRKEIWAISVTGHKIFNQTTIGAESEVTWKLKEGDFTWLRMEVTEIH